MLITLNTQVRIRKNSASNLGVFHGKLFLLILFFANSFIAGQSSPLETEKGIDAAIAPYSAEIREAILLSSMHPEILTQLQEAQSKTIASFQQLIKKFGQKKQGWFYDLTRYPNLQHTLATLPNGKNKDEVLQLLPSKDPDLQTASWNLYSKEKNDLIQVDNIAFSAQRDFDHSLANLDPHIKAAFQKLSESPDVLALLTSNIELTTRLGAHYADNPDRLTNLLTALHDSLSVQNQYEVATLKSQMENNPQAIQEMKQAAKGYASDSGYNLPNQQNYNYNSNANNFGNPYSYWFGYPSWYSSPLWYPGSFGYNSGFYNGVGGFGLYGFPSYGFSNWFFNGGNYNRYPNLYRQFGNYYHGNTNGNRVLGSVNNGFMGVAHNHYSPNTGSHMNYLTSPNNYNRPRGENYRPGINATHTNANTYHAQSWGSFGGNGGNFGGNGGFHGGGSRGMPGSGSRGAGGRH